MKNKRAEPVASFRVKIVSSVVFGALLWPEVILAQDVEAQPAATLETVVVTGEKIQRSQQDTLSSVAVVTATDMREHGDKTLSDMLARTPGVYSTAGNETFGIRGIPVQGLTESYGTSDLITVYMDDAPQSRRRSIFSPFSSWDVDQVEVFMGPQSTVQGRNALAGAIVMRSTDPTFKSERAMRVNAGNYDTYGASALWGGAIVPGVMAGRLSVDYQESSGYIHNDYLNDDANRNDALTARGKLRIVPNDNVDILLSYAHQDSRLGQRAVDMTPDGPRYWNLTSNIDAHEKIKQDNFSAKADVLLNPEWTLTGILTGGRENYDTKQDFDFATLDMDDSFVIKSEVQQLTQEVRLSRKGKDWRGHIGFYNASVDEDEDAGVPSFALTRLRDTTIDNRAVFTEFEWDVTSQWQLIGGLRYDHEKNTTDQRGDLGEGQSTRSFDAILPKVGVSYSPMPDQRVGLTVQRGYRAGGSSFNLFEERPVEYDPEYTTNYELAWRSRWLDQRLQLNANIFYTDWRDQQVEVYSVVDEPFSAQIENAGASHLQGLEISSVYQVTPALKLLASGSYTKTEFDEFMVNGVNYGGRSFQMAPEHKVALGAIYRWGQGWMTGADVVYQSDSVSVYNSDGSERRADASTLVNVKLEKSIAKWGTVTAFAKNLFNDKYITNNQGDDTLDVGAPRLIGAELKVNW